MNWFNLLLNHSLCCRQVMEESMHLLLLLLPSVVSVDYCSCDGWSCLPVDRSVCLLCERPGWYGASGLLLPAMTAGQPNWPLLCVCIGFEIKRKTARPRRLLVGTWAWCLHGGVACRPGRVRQQPPACMSAGDRLCFSLPNDQWVCVCVSATSAQPVCELWGIRPDACNKRRVVDRTCLVLCDLMAALMGLLCLLYMYPSTYVLCVHDETKWLHLHAGRVRASCSSICICQLYCIVLVNH